jgi:hypothetical protein
MISFQILTYPTAMITRSSPLLNRYYINYEIRLINNETSFETLLIIRIILSILCDILINLYRTPLRASSLSLKIYTLKSVRVRVSNNSAPSSDTSCNKSKISMAIYFTSTGNSMCLRYSLFFIKMTAAS